MIRAGIYFFASKRAHSSSLGSRLIASGSDEFSYVSPIPEDRDQEVLVHVRNFFFVEEPLNKAIGLSTKGKPHKELDAMTLDSLSQRLSVMAVHKATDKLAAVSVNTVELPGSLAKKKNWAETISCAEFKRVIKLSIAINEPLQLHNRYGVDKIFENFILSTDEAYRGKGLGGKSLKASEDIARKNNFKLMKAECTGVYSQKGFTSAGFETVNELKYADYLDENRQQIFKVEPPHESVKVMVKVLK